jgi:hypothetical protein
MERDLATREGEMYLRANRPYKTSSVVLVTNLNQRIDQSYRSSTRLPSVAQGSKHIWDEREAVPIERIAILEPPSYARGRAEFRTLPIRPAFKHQLRTDSDSTVIRTGIARHTPAYISYLRQELLRPL